MQTEFFPSRTLTLYLVRIFATRIVAVLLMLVLILQMLDLLGESGKILARPGNTDGHVWYYVSLRARSWWRASCPIRFCWQPS